ncbi:hypothetical protein A2U01_0091184, partial [Trifolium medium]|nr:hypothetical protein [Trifolium medium]
MPSSNFLCCFQAANSGVFPAA